MKPGYSQFFQLNDIHGYVIKTKPAEHFWGGGYGEYKVNEVGLIQEGVGGEGLNLKFLEGLLLFEKPEAQLQLETTIMIIQMK